MLDGERYYAEFPDERPAAAAAPGPDPGPDPGIRAALAKLALLEQELARFLRDSLAADRH